jgi:CPA1 family monovalent cation:H+ antiporter
LVCQDEKIAMPRFLGQVPTSGCPLYPVQLLQIAAASRTVSFGLSIFVAFVIGRAAALLNLAIPAEMLHGSGLGAAVVAGFVIGARAPRDLPPRHRVSDAQNWATIEIGLEGAIFLTMGLQLSTIVRQVAIEPAGVEWGLVCAALTLAATVAIRAAYVALLLWRLHRSASGIARCRHRRDRS